MVEQTECPIYEGQHEAIISEEEWNLAQIKRKKNAYKREKINDPDHWNKESIREADGQSGC